MYGTYLVENNRKFRAISNFSLARIRIFQNCVEKEVWRSLQVLLLGESLLLMYKNRFIKSQLLTRFWAFRVFDRTCVAGIMDHLLIYQGNNGWTYLFAVWMLLVGRSERPSINKISDLHSDTYALFFILEPISAERISNGKVTPKKIKSWIENAEIAPNQKWVSWGIIWEESDRSEN